MLAYYVQNQNYSRMCASLVSRSCCWDDDCLP